MGEIRNTQPALLLIAVSSRYDQALAWTARRCSLEFGPQCQQSEIFDFTETDYYQTTMGTELKKQFLTFQTLIDPGGLPQIKRISNDLEQEYAQLQEHPEPRPLNLDPGYITLAKLVLASTKDHAHRIYLGQGIYAEITLHYRHGKWRHHPWTFRDYRRADYHEFFDTCRDYVLRHRQAG